MGALSYLPVSVLSIHFQSDWDQDSNEAISKCLTVFVQSILGAFRFLFKHLWPATDTGCLTLEVSFPRLDDLLISLYPAHTKQSRPIIQLNLLCVSQWEAGFFFRKLFVSFVNIELMWLTKTLWICFVESKDILSETLQAANINYDTLQSRDGKQAVDSQYRIPSEPHASEGSIHSD